MSRKEGGIAEFQHATRQLTRFFEAAVTHSLGVRFEDSQCVIEVTPGSFARLSPALAQCSATGHLSIQAQGLPACYGTAFIRQITAVLAPEQPSGSDMSAVLFTLHYVSPHGHEIPGSTVFVLPTALLESSLGPRDRDSWNRWRCKLVEGTPTCSPQVEHARHIQPVEYGQFVATNASDIEVDEEDRPEGYARAETVWAAGPFRPVAPGKGGSTASHATHASPANGADPSYGPQQNRHLPSGERNREQKVEFCEELPGGERICREASDDNLMNEAMLYRD
ncbi:MAG: hypothetical protein GF331_11325 [Chitinivibrionales bacterium]|nr:hypothetical protein [Chitinivibrionales bacterium]